MSMNIWTKSGQVNDESYKTVTLELYYKKISDYVNNLNFEIKSFVLNKPTSK